jgi:glycosyltransferase involved in cell wall biosynthesis
MIPIFIAQIIFYCFCFATAVQIFYYLFFFSRIAFYKSKTKAVSQTHPVSVIICAKNEAANLAKNLPGALVQKYRTTHEVIVINDNSVDDSEFVLEAYQKEFKQLQLVALKQEARFIPGKKFPLSVGIKTAKHEVLLMTDADCVPASEFWIEKMQQGYHANTEIVLGYGAHHKKKEFLNKLVRWETFHTALQYLSYAAAGLAYMGVGRNLSYKKSVFFRHKGFSSHNHVASGDDDLFINLAATKTNTQIVIDKESFTLSEPPRTWKEWMKQKRRHYTTSRYYKNIHKFLLGMYALSHGVFYPLFIASLIFFSWKISLIVFAVRLLVQFFIFYKALDKLDEKDLLPWFFVLDVWMFFYYIIFSFAMTRKPMKTWK